MRKNAQFYEGSKIIVTRAPQAHVCHVKLMRKMQL